MKLSVSLRQEDVELLDAYVAEQGLASRSAGVQYAVRRLRDAELETAYTTAWSEWNDSPDAEAWAATLSDGPDDEAW